MMAEQLTQLEQRVFFLQSMQSNFEVARLNPDTKKPGDWHFISRMPFGKEEIATRTQLENELILELDKPTAIENVALSKQIIETLKKNDFKFEVFTGGTKSIHIHLFFENKISNHERETFIDYYLIEYKTFLDKAYWTKKSQMIAMEYAPHFKTGKKKELIEAYGSGTNKLEGLKLTKCGIINYALGHQLPEGERNAIIMPNFVALNPPRELIEKMIETQKMPPTDITGWKKTRFFCGQLKKYWKNMGLPDLCSSCNRKKEIKDDERPNHNELAEEIIQKYKIITFSDTDEMLSYFPETGLYEPAQQIIEFEIQEIVGNETTTNYVNEVLNSIRRRTRVAREVLQKEINLIPLKNGVFDTKTKTIVPYSKDHVFVAKHNLFYEPQAKCEKIEKFLSEITKNEQDKLLLKEMVGYCFVKHYKFHTIFLLIGTGANGKSVLLNLLIEMLGENCVSQKPLQLLTNYFFCVASLFGKNANIFADLPKKAFNDTGIIKALSGNDWIDAEIKHKGEIRFKSYAKLIASCNELPETPDESDGFFRRPIIIDFPNKFEGEKENINLLQELTTEEEKSGFFNQAITAFLEAEARGHLSYLPSTQEKRKIYLNYSNSVKVFCDETMELDSNGEIEKSHLYEMYQEYCQKQKIPLKPVVWFFREFYKFWGGNARQSRKDGTMKVLGVSWKGDFCAG